MMYPKDTIKQILLVLGYDISRMRELIAYKTEQQCIKLFKILESVRKSNLEGQTYFTGTNISTANNVSNSALNIADVLKIYI